MAINFNNAQRIALVVAVANMALAMMFPPFDYISMQHGGIPTFDGFYFVVGYHQNRMVNANFLSLEFIVIAINACIALLLLRDPPVRQKQGSGNRRQRIVLLLVALNLVLALLFPPFEYFGAITKAALPTFEGFYFVFADNSQRHLVMPILYIEITLILVNGALLWLLFRNKGERTLSKEEVRELARRVHDTQSK